nr:protein phosphatase 2C family protein [Tanacetum cinerariifolium]
MTHNQDKNESQDHDLAYDGLMDACKELANLAKSIVFFVAFLALVNKEDYIRPKLSAVMEKEREEIRVCKWSFTADLRGLGFKDEDVNDLYYRESMKTVTNGLRLIHDEASLYEMLSYASRTGLVELYVGHSED